MKDLLVIDVHTAMAILPDWRVHLHADNVRIED